MADSKRVVIVGGHGKIALLTAPSLTSAGYAVESLIRNPDHRQDVEAAGATPVLLDIEEADVEALTEAFDGASAVVFTAGAGGGNPARTHAVDYGAATRTMQAAQRAGVRRYVMVSYVRAAVDVDRIDPEEAFYHYAKAKHDADADLRRSELDHTILGPGRLTMEPASGKVLLVDDFGEAGQATLSDEQKVTSRANVAQVITHVITTGSGIGVTYNFYDGDMPIAEAMT